MTQRTIGTNRLIDGEKIDNLPADTNTELANLNAELDGKVDKVSGKGLSTEDYTTTEKNKLAGIEENANNYVLPSDVVQDATYVKTDNNFTNTLKTKLDNIEAGAEVNTLNDVIAGTNITIDKTDPLNPIINSTGGGGGSSTLDGLTDVTITSPSNGQALTYDTATSQWINSTPSGGGDMLKSVYDTNNDGIVNEADVITNQGDLATLDNVDTAQIVNKAVTNTKLENMNANTVKGRLSGNGTPQDVAMADLPISTATQTALNGKVTGNSAITGATKTKITYDSKGLVTAGADLIESDIPTLAQSKITNLVTDLGNKADKGSITTSGLTQSTNKLLGRSTASTGAVEEITLGTNLSFTGTTLNASTTPIRITIPGEQIADTSNYQGLYWYNNTGATITISNVAFAVGKAAAGSGAACAYNLYKSSGTASDGLNTNAVALFSSAVNLGTNYTSLTNVPNTTTVENGRWITLRVTSSAGATSKASDAQCIISYS